MEVEKGWVSTVCVALEGDTAWKTHFLSPYSPRRGTVVGGAPLPGQRVQLLYPGLAHTGFNWT